MGVPQLLQLCALASLLLVLLLLETMAGGLRPSPTLTPRKPGGSGAVVHVVWPLLLLWSRAGHAQNKSSSASAEGREDGVGDSMLEIVAASCGWRAVRPAGRRWWFLAAGKRREEKGECLCALACNPFVRAVRLTIKGQGSLHGGLKVLQQFQQYQPQAETKRSVCECVSAYALCT